MARRKVQFAPGEYYHVYNRGCSKLDIFRNESDYLRLRWLLDDSLEKRNVSMIAFCLMPNHYHFLLRQESQIPISNVCFDVFNAYVKGFNNKYGRSGTLFEERFKAKHIANDDYLVQLCRYIHRNPVDAGLVSRIGYWRHSDYLEWIAGKQKGHIARKLFSGPADYARFVEEYEPDPEAGLALQEYMFD